MNEKQKQIKEILLELGGLMIDYQVELNNTKGSHIDMEQYEGTEVEDLVHSHYINGKCDMLIEIKDLLCMRLR